MPALQTAGLQLGAARGRNAGTCGRAASGSNGPRTASDPHGQDAPGLHPACQETKGEAGKPDQSISSGWVLQEAPIHTSTAPVLSAKCHALRDGKGGGNRFISGETEGETNPKRKDRAGERLAPKEDKNVLGYSSAHLCPMSNL